MAVTVRNFSATRAKWLKESEKLESLDENQDKKRELMAKVKLYLQNLTVIRLIKLDFRFGDNRNGEVVEQKYSKIQRLFMMPSTVPDPPPVTTAEWAAVQNNRSNQGLGTVRRNNEIFDTNAPAERS